MIVLEWLFLTIAPCDATELWQLGYQDAATPMMQGIIDLHHDIFFFLILILVFVSRILVRALWHFQKEKKSNLAMDCSWNYYRDYLDHISQYHPDVHCYTIICSLILNGRGSSKSSHYYQSYWTSMVSECASSRG
ncbi:putative cytochrome-c oxidase [Helianthus debilis subsp. tardiflorus]